MRFMLFDRWGAPLGDLRGVTSAVRTREAGGSDELEVACSGEVSKDDRIVWRDSMGRWCEHLVYEVAVERGDSEPIARVWAAASWRELSRKFVIESEGRSYSAQRALEKALDGTRWAAGTADGDGVADVSFYHVSALDALQDVADTFGLEIEASYEADATGITSRTLSLVSARGSDSGRRFEYGRDLVDVKRTVEAADVVTRLYAYGKGVQATDEAGEATGGYTRKVDFADINGGRPYVEDAAALANFGMVGPGGQRVHAEGMAEFPDCSDPAELLRLAREALPSYASPTVSYEADVASLGRGGLDARGVDVGDSVQIVDATFPEPLRLEGRVLKLEEDLLGSAASDRVTLGNVSETLTSQRRKTQASVDRLTSNSGAWDSAAGLGREWLDGVIAGLNQQMNEAGGWYYMEPGEGITVYDRPRDQSPTKAIQLGGGGLRIANSKRANGEWDWRTFGTGDGFTADLIQTGRLMASLIKVGAISDVAGKNLWNMETGEFRLASGATVGGKTVSQIASGAVNAQTQQSIFNKLTNGGKEQGIYLQDGLVWINGEYIKADTVVASKLMDRQTPGSYGKVGNVTIDGAARDGIADFVGDVLRFAICTFGWDSNPLWAVYARLADGSVSNVLMSSKHSVSLATLGTSSTNMALILDGTGLKIRKGSTIKTVVTW